MFLCFGVVYGLSILNVFEFFCCWNLVRVFKMYSCLGFVWVDFDLIGLWGILVSEMFKSFLGNYNVEKRLWIIEFV